MLDFKVIAISISTETGQPALPCSLNRLYTIGSPTFLKTDIPKNDELKN